MFENEQCWLLTGRKWRNLWIATKYYQGDGTPTRVKFDGNYVLELEEKNKNVIGFLHTHPNMIASPSTIDDATMWSWVSCFGKPLLCGIIGIDGMKFYNYFDDESDPKEIGFYNFGDLFVGRY